MNLDPRLKRFARHLRENHTDAERRLWTHLRDQRFEGLKFRRQHPVGGYIVDFYCHEAHLVIELDGGQHGEPKIEDRDEARTARLEAMGIKVLRYWNHDVLARTEMVLENCMKPSPQPSPRGRGAEVWPFTR